MPLDAVDTCLCMGAGIAMAQLAVAPRRTRRWRSWATPAVLHKRAAWPGERCVQRPRRHRVVWDNATTAMTGSRPQPGTGVTLGVGRPTHLHPARVLEAVGFDCIVHAKSARPLDAVAGGPCARRARPDEGFHQRRPVQVAVHPAGEPDAPAVVDAETCTGCKKYRRRMGCPGIGFRRRRAQPRSRRVSGQAFVNPSLCNGCGLCVQVSLRCAVDDGTPNRCFT